MRILTAVATPLTARYIAPALNVLAERGHDVQIAWSDDEARSRLTPLASAAGDPVVWPELDERVRAIGFVPRRQDVYADVATELRGLMDYIRYLDARFADQPALRERMAAVVPSAVNLTGVPALPPPTIAAWLHSLSSLERSIPVSAAVRTWLAVHQPDVVVVSPLVNVASDQVDIVRAAQAGGIPIVAVIPSWDNLVNKGHLRVCPDVLVVWNAAQRLEAIAFHGMPAERVVVAGATVYDAVWAHRPRISRDDFGMQTGAIDPFVLYMGSSPSVVGGPIAELPFLRRWLARLRSDDRFRNTFIVVRPHPSTGSEWASVTLDDRAVVVSPTVVPLFESLCYADAAVGINTSAMLEAAIVDTPVLTIDDDDFKHTRGWHFRYLPLDNGGCASTATTLDEHVNQLDHALRDPEASAPARRAFVQAFMRPCGIDRPVAPIVADIITGTRRVES